MHTHDDMISVEEARERILAHIATLESEESAVLDALGQVLAEDVYAPFNIPPMDNSAMDGYAVQFDDIARASAEQPATLDVVGLVAAGYIPDQPVRPGTAMRIMTGAPVPDGADTVVPFEETDEVDQRSRGVASTAITRIGIRDAAPLGSNVRATGGDVQLGALILAKGSVLGAAHIGVLASLGKGRAAVIRRPSVVILATGDELKEPGEPIGPGQIYNSNSYAIAAQVMACGGRPKLLPIARDTVQDLQEKVRLGLHADLFITSAGVSTGEYDLVKDVLTSEGTMDFWRVRMRPGKPLAFGMLRRPDGSTLPHLGLPGNPVSSMVAFDQFARPAILKMMGRPINARVTITATLQESVINTDPRRFYARVIVTRTNNRYYARLTGPQGSNVLTSMALANGLLIVPEHQELAPEGSEVQVQLFEGSEDLLG